MTFRRFFAAPTLFTVLVACGRGDAPSHAPPAASASQAIAVTGSIAPMPSASAASATPSPSVGAAPSSRPRAVATGTPTAAKAIGHTSLVFKVHLKAEDGREENVVFKARFKKGPDRFRGEIAAFRLGEALGIGDRLPVAAPVTFPASSFRALLSGDSATAYDDGALIDGSARGPVVRGASLGWIKGLSFYPLEKKAFRDQALAELKQGAPPYVARLPQPRPVAPDEASLLAALPDAEEVSTLLAFDWLTGNFDRWSGANVGRDDATGHLIYIDNDGAFLDPMPAAPLARQWQLVDGCDRYSKRFVASLRSLDADALRAALGTGVAEEPLLKAPVLAGVIERRTKLLAAIDAKIAKWGAEAVLAYP